MGGSNLVPSWGGGPLYVGIRAQLLIAPGAKENKTVPLKNLPPQPKQQARFIAKKAMEVRAEN